MNYAILSRGEEQLDIGGGSPGIKEDACCDPASAKRLTEAGQLRGAPSSSSPRGKGQPRRAGAAGPMAGTGAS